MPDPSSPSPSEPAGPSSSTPTSAPPTAETGGFPGIRYSDRVLVVGKTREGKSTLARELFLSAAAPRLVIDPADSELTAKIPGQRTFRHPREFPLDAETARFVPINPAARKPYDEVYRTAFEHFPRYTWLDEPNDATPSSGFPPWANTYVAQGAKRGLGHLTCTTSIRWIMRSLVRNVQVLVMFTTPAPEDRRYLAQMIGIDVGDLEAAHAALGPHEFLVWAGGPLIHCPPLDVR